MSLIISKVTCGESKASHFANMQEKSWTLVVETVDEMYEYKNLGIYKNYCGSFNANIDENIEKTRKKTGMIFSAIIDRHKTDPLIYVKYWKQVCLPSLLFVSEIFSLTPTLLTRLERCQRWFIKSVVRGGLLKSFSMCQNFPRVFLLKDWLV